MIRRIQERDCAQAFKTGEERFDFDEQGNPIGLSFYLERDRSSSYLSYVLEEKGEIIGVLCIEIVQRVLYLSRIGVQQKYRFKGHGYFLHEFLMDIVEEKGIKVIYCKVHENVFRWFTELGYLKVHEYDDPHWGKSADMMLLIG